MAKQETRTMFMIVLLFSFSFTMYVSLPYTSNVAMENIQIPEEDHTFAGDITHGKVLITSDQDFIDQSWDGAGTENDPYLIENLNITGGASIECIEILDTRSFFEVRNCTLTGSTSTAALELNNVTNGLIKGNDFHVSDTAINIYYSNDVVVSDNLLIANTVGIDCLGDRLTVQNNTIDGGDYGIRGHYSIDLVIFNNTVSGASDCSILIENADYTVIENNTCIGNRIYLFTNSDYCSIRYNKLYNSTSEGIRSATKYNTITHNLCMNVSEGIRSFSHDTLANNTLTLCEIGFYLHYTIYALIENNTFTLNDIGLTLPIGADHNDLIGNIFDSNVLNVKDDGEDNFFGTNYWSNYTGTDGDGDGIGDVPHPIDGIAANEDLHPLMTSSTPRIGMNWDNVLVDHVVELGNDFRYDLNCTGSEPIYWWLTDGGGWAPSMTIDQDGVITNTSSISGIRSDHLDISARNIYSAFIEIRLNITIQDTLPPVWDEIPQDQIIEYGTEFFMQFKASDMGEIEYWVNDTVTFEFNIDDIRAYHLPVGVYGLEVRATDPEGLYISATFKVTCQDTITPVVDHPDDIEVVFSDALVFEYITWTASDESILTYVILLDGEEVQTGTLSVSLFFEADLSSLSPGTYNYTIIITDEGGNQVSDTVLVVITPAVSTPTDSTTPDTTTTSDPPVLGDLTTTVIIAGGGIAAVGIVVLLIKRR